MKRTDRILLIAVTLLHVLAQVYAFMSLAGKRPTPHEIHRIAVSQGFDPVAYRESFRYTLELYPFLPPDTVWLKRSR